MPTQEKLLRWVQNCIENCSEVNVYLIEYDDYIHLTICKQENVREDILIYFDYVMNLLNKRCINIKLELINCFIDEFEDEIYPLFGNWVKLVSLRLIGDNIDELQRLSGNRHLEELEILTSNNNVLNGIHSLTSIRYVRHNNQVFSSDDELAPFREPRPAN